MSEQPSHEPTPRRLAEARRRGLIAHSHDLRAAVALAAAFVALIALGPSIAGQAVAYFRDALARAPAGGSAGAAAVQAVSSGLRVLAVPLAAAFVLTLVAGFAQTGGLWIGPPRADLGRLSPASGWRRLAQGRGLAASAESAVKLAVLALVAWVTLAGSLPRLPWLAGAPAARILDVFGATARQLGLRLLAGALLIGAADAVLARRRHRRALRMTRRELDRERRELEGDPIQRAERRRRSAEDLETQPPRALPDPVLVVTGGAPTGGDEGDPVIAVALAYERGGARAPIVVASGRRAEAARIAAAARAAFVPVFDDGALALALGGLDAGAEIPEETYDRVAELMRAGALPEETLATHGASGARH